MTGLPLILLSSGAACAMGLTSARWAETLATLIWTIQLRPRYIWPTVALLLAIWYASLIVLLMLLHATLVSASGALAFWLIPFVAAPAINVIARWRDKDASPRPMANLGEYIIDMERARLKREYQPPPVL